MNISNTHYIFSLLLPFVFVMHILNKAPLVVAGGNPSWEHGGLSSRGATGGAISVAGLKVLKTYVCPPCANAIRRQVDTKIPGAMTVTIPIEEVSELWQELQWILEQLSVILKAEGLLSQSTVTTGLPTGLPTALATLVESAFPLDLLTSPNAEVGTPSMTASTGATFLPATAVATSIPLGTTTGQIPDTEVQVVRFTTGPLVGPTAGSSVDTPGSSILFSLTSGAAATSQDSPVSPFAAFPTITTPGSACYATETIEETTTISPSAAVQSFAQGATASSLSQLDSTLASALSPPSGEVFVATSISLVQLTPTATASYIFNSQSTTNVAVYFGQSGVTGETTLKAQCADPNIDIVILAFVITSNYHGEYPDVNFGAACGGQTPKMIAEAPGLLSCPELESYIDICQQTYGKKVLLSVGGSTSSLSFTSSSNASDFANMLWQLFGPPGNLDIDLRPFGNVSIDGFDIDNENQLPAYFDIFASTLRKDFKSDTSKSYYLSSAPQCPFPDASDPLAMLLICDFVFVQFYNNPPCEIGSTDFAGSLQQWSMALEASTLSTKPRLYLGAPAWSEAGPNAYEHIGSAKGMQGIAKDVEDMRLVNFGGVMFWDGPEAMLNTEDGKDILEWAKEGLSQ